MVKDKLISHKFYMTSGLEDLYKSKKGWERQAMSEFKLKRRKREWEHHGVILREASKERPWNYEIEADGNRAGTNWVGLNESDIAALSRLWERELRPPSERERCGDVLSASHPHICIRYNHDTDQTPHRCKIGFEWE
jgi:hypothetical protein